MDKMIERINVGQVIGSKHLTISREYFRTLRVILIN